MALNLNSILSLTVSLINKHNTTTSGYNISNGLTNQVKLVTEGDPEIVPIASTQYPVVLVNLKSKSEEFSEMGNTARRWINIYMEICPITQVGAGLSYDNFLGQKTANKEIFLLTQNIETLLRAYPRMSTTSMNLTALLSETRFERIQGVDTYNKTARIAYTVRALST